MTKNNQNNVTKVMTTNEVAEHLSVDRMTLNRWETDGILKPIRITPSTLRYRVEDVEKLLQHA